MNFLSHRKPLVSVNSGAITTGGSMDLGAFSVAGFPRFSGILSTVGSLSIRLRTGISLGNYQSSSLWSVGSGFSAMECPN
jgi:hypothetical protein